MNRRYLIDLTERVIFTFVPAYLGLWTASGLDMQYLTDLSTSDKALVSLLPAGYSLIKGIVARFIGSPNTAAVLPVGDDTPSA